MSYRCLSSDINLNSFIFPCRISSINGYCFRRRRRRSAPGIRCQLGIESLFDALHLVSPLDLITPVFGLASAAAGVYFYRFMRSTDDSASVGDWILFTSLMQFNRCVFLRCPSVSYEDGVNDRLLSEEQNCARFRRGRIPLIKEGGTVLEKDFIFQRVCVKSDDGGMISMDWPDYMDLELEQGLETTILIIPGTPEGSMDRKVKLLVSDAVKHGCFPIVMNPRGCAGSPLTTARLFTAADSEDVNMAVKYVSSLRPSATLMGIGWGYGANMLTKYLAEGKERTPVSAAVCIDTPFQLIESMNSPPHHTALSEKLLGGLKEILDANKELFQGKTKGFDVANALSATSIRDFDSSISMVSYGFESLEDFYKKSNTGQLIDNLKIPILFIQSDDGTVPLLSIPHKSITDNPFTSLIICSCSHSTYRKGVESALLWSQQLAIEWLSAVEFALLRGHHPLLNNADITIKPYMGMPTSGVHKKLISGTVNGLLAYPIDKEDDRDACAYYDNLLSRMNLNSKFYEMGNEIEDQKDAKIKGILMEGAMNDVSGEGSPAPETATVIMSMLDAAMPGALNEEKKKKVLYAMEQGETFIKALQGAVPEDVRAKVSTAVAEITHGQLNIEAFQRNGWFPNSASELNSIIEGKSLLNESTNEHIPLEHIQDIEPNGTLVKEMPDSISQWSLSSSTNSEESSLIKSCMQEVKNDEKSKQVSAGQNTEISSRSEDVLTQFSSSDSHQISVSQALDVLTGFDDSTQKAVNSVFGVVEKMIDQLDKNSLESDHGVERSENQRFDNESNDDRLTKRKKLDNLSHLYECGLSSNEDREAEMGYRKVNIPSSDEYAEISEDGNEASHFKSTKLRRQSLVQSSISMVTTGKNIKVQSFAEPNYVIFDGEFSNISDLARENFTEEKLFCLIKRTILYNLKLEVHRRISVFISEQFYRFLAFDMENFAEKVSRAVVPHCDLNYKVDLGTKVAKCSTIEGHQIVEIVLSALQDTCYLRNVLPPGIIIGSSLTSLRTYFRVDSLFDYAEKPISRAAVKQHLLSDHEHNIKNVSFATENLSKAKKGRYLKSIKETNKDIDEFETVQSNDNGIVVGAVATALGASALFANSQNMPYENANSEEFMDQFNRDRSQSNIVSCLTEKAMSVAAPLVPTKSDGQLDHQRLVAMLAELGQKGGMLRFIGKVALLWGGMRGAMSLADKLITFLHLADRPLHQRIFGFVCMVLVLWSPVIIPLLPALVQSWTAHDPNRIVEFSCIVGLYIAAMLLIVLWGKRIRGYEDSVEQYGLGITSIPEVYDFLKGLAGGSMMILCIHSVNVSLGYASFAWIPSSPPQATVLLRNYVIVLFYAVQRILLATCISAVEELLFRSWLVDEVAADLGYYPAILISGTIFALMQRSLGFLLLSIILSSIKQRAHGKLAAPIGIRTGLMATNFVVQKSSLLSYRLETTFWLASPHHHRPFDGPVGLSLFSILAIFFFFFFPKAPQKKLCRSIREE